MKIKLLVVTTPMVCCHATSWPWTGMMTCDLGPARLRCTKLHHSILHSQS